MPQATDAVWVDVLPSMRNFGSTLAKDLSKEADAAGRKAGDNFSGGFGSSVRKLAAVAGAAVAGIGIGNFFKDAITGASDLSETMNKATVIFGDQAAEMSRWATNSARAFGLSRAEALEAAAGFGNMFSQLGFTGKQAASMSQQVIQLSTDLGSFNNLPTAEVADMISAAFRGEYDSLQRLIPNINAARVEQEALAMTHKKSAKDLTASEKAAATFAIIQRDGAAAANDFAETSGGLANQQKILSAVWEDAKATLGEGLLPVVTAAASWLGERLPAALGTVTGWMRQFTNGLTGNVEVMDQSARPALELLGIGLRALVSAFQDGDVTSDGFVGAMERLGVVARGLFNFFTDVAIPAVSGLVGWMRDHMGVVVGLTAAVGALVAITRIHGAVLAVQAAGGLAAYILQLNVVQGLIRVVTAVQWAWNLAMNANPLGLIVAGLLLLGGALILAWKYSDTFRAVVVRAWETIKVGAAATVDWFTDTAWPALQSVWNGIAAGATWLWRNVLQPAWSGISTGFQAMSTVIQAYWNGFLRPVLELFGAVAQWLWQTVLLVVFNFIQQRWQGLCTAMQLAWNTVLKPVWDGVAATAQWLWGNVLSPVFTFIQAAWNAALRLMQLAWVTVLKPAWDAVSVAASWLWNSVLSPVFTWIGQKWNLVLAGIRLAWDTVLKPTFDFLARKVEEVKLAFQAGVDAMGRAWDGLKEKAKAPIRFVVDTVINGALIDNFNKLAGFFGTSKIARLSLPAGFAAGGPVMGPGTGTSDSILARLSAGEFVVRSAQARKWGPVLERINTPGFAAGGFVGDIYEGAKNAVAGIGDMLADPAGFMRKAAERVFGGIGDSQFAQSLLAVPRKILGWITDKVQGMFAGAGGAAVPVGGGGGNAAGLMAFGRLMQSMGVRVSEGPGPFGPVHRVHTANSRHYAGRALDLNYGPGGMNATEMRFFDNVVRQGLPQKYGLRTIWRAPGHYNHMHVDYDSGGWLPPGMSVVRNNTGRPEAVLNPQQWASLESMADRRGGAGFNFLVKSERTWTASEALQLVARAEAMYL